MKKLNKVPMEIYGFLNILKMTAKVVKNTNISTLSATEMGSELFYLETSFGNYRKQKKNEIYLLNITCYKIANFNGRMNCRFLIIFFCVYVRVCVWGGVGWGGAVSIYGPLGIQIVNR